MSNVVLAMVLPETTRSPAGGTTQQFHAAFVAPATRSAPFTFVGSAVIGTVDRLIGLGAAADRGLPIRGLASGDPKPRLRGVSPAVPSVSSLVNSVPPYNSCAAGTLSYRIGFHHSTNSASEWSDFAGRPRRRACFSLSLPPAGSFVSLEDAGDSDRVSLVTSTSRNRSSAF